MGLEHPPDAGLARRAGAGLGDLDHLVRRPLDELGGGILFGRSLPGRHDGKAGAGERDGGCAGGQTQHASTADER